MAFQIQKLEQLPVEYRGDTLYFIKEADTGLSIYLTNTAGDSVQYVASTQKTIDDSISSIVVTSDTAPATTVTQLLWLNSTTMTLYVKYDDGDSVTWVETMPSVPIPQFAGTGEANTMARSDHNHDETYLKIVDVQW